MSPWKQQKAIWMGCRVLGLPQAWPDCFSSVATARVTGQPSSGCQEWLHGLAHCALLMQETGLSLDARLQVCEHLLSEAGPVAPAATVLTPQHWQHDKALLVKLVQLRCEELSLQLAESEARLQQSLAEQAQRSQV